MKYYYEDYPLEKEIPARIYISESGAPNCHYPLHWHRDLEFDYVQSGCLKATVGGESLTVGSGDFLFVNSGELHETDSADKNPLSCITIILSYRLLSSFCPDLDAIEFDLSEKPEARREIIALMLECAEVYTKKAPLYSLDLSILLQKICRVLLLNARDREKRADEPQEDRSLFPIKRAIAYIEENYSAALPQGEIAKEIGMAPTYFSRFFKKMTGQTFHNYLTNVRLYNAYLMLSDRSKTISEISLLSGFPNVKSFIEAFKASYSATPDSFRRRLLERDGK